MPQGGQSAPRSRKDRAPGYTGTFLLPALHRDTVFNSPDLPWPMGVPQALVPVSLCTFLLHMGFLVGCWGFCASLGCSPPKLILGTLFFQKPKMATSSWSLGAKSTGTYAKNLDLPFSASNNHRVKKKESKWKPHHKTQNKIFDFDSPRRSRKKVPVILR